MPTTPNDPKGHPPDGSAGRAPVPNVRGARDQPNRGIRRVIPAAIAISGLYLLAHLAIDFLARGQFGPPTSRDDVTTLQLRQLKADFGYNKVNPFMQPAKLGNALEEAFRKTTGKELNENRVYRCLVLAIIMKETGFRTTKKVCTWLPIPRLGGDAKGMMQCRWSVLPDDPGGFRAGMQVLDRAVLIYAPDRQIKESQLGLILADWNTGSYSSEIATLQDMLDSKLPPTSQIALDGDVGPETAAAFIRLGYANSPGVNLLLDENIRSLSRADLEPAVQAKKSLLESPEIAGLLSDWDKRNGMTIANAPVRGAAKRLFEWFSGPDGWLSSKEFVEKAMRLYLEIEKDSRSASTPS
jgi:hypothetical protein